MNRLKSASTSIGGGLIKLDIPARNSADTFTDLGKILTQSIHAQLPPVTKHANCAPHLLVYHLTTSRKEILNIKTPLIPHQKLQL